MSVRLGTHVNHSFEFVLQLTEHVPIWSCRAARPPRGSGVAACAHGRSALIQTSRAAETTSDPLSCRVRRVPHYLGHRHLISPRTAAGPSTGRTADVATATLEALRRAQSACTASKPTPHATRSSLAAGQLSLSCAIYHWVPIAIPGSATH